ncbi:MAG: PilZ domain-containing protein [Bacillota bacterium]
MEKRSLSRVLFNTKAIVRCRGTELDGEVENVSLNGMYIRTQQKIPIGEMVEITMHLAGDTSSLSINLEGKVIRSAEGGIGLMYQKVDLDSFIHLRNIVSYNSVDSDRVMDEFLQFIKKNISKSKQSP